MRGVHEDGVEVSELVELKIPQQKSPVKGVKIAFTSSSSAAPSWRAEGKQHNNVGTVQSQVSAGPACAGGQGQQVRKQNSLKRNLKATQQKDAKSGDARLASTAPAGIFDEFRAALAPKRIDHKVLFGYSDGAPTPKGPLSMLASVLGDEHANAALTRLDLSGQDLGCSGVQKLVSALTEAANEREGPSSTYREQWDRRRALSSKPQHLPNLSLLALSDNRIGLAGAVALSKYLSHEKTRLSTLNLRGNVLGDDGVAALAGALG
eukprot:5542368-Pleurochrysis_carterae.AAC.1